MTSILKVQYCYKYRYSTYFTRFQITRVLCLSILSLHRTHTIASTIQYIQHLCILSIYTIYTIIYTIQNIRYTSIWNMSFVLLHDIPAAHGSCSTLKKMLSSKEDRPLSTPLALTKRRAFKMHYSLRHKLFDTFAQQTGRHRCTSL